MSDFHFVAAVPAAGTQAGMPIGDFIAGGTTISDIVCMSKYNTCYFFVFWGNQTGGTETPICTVIPCSTAGAAATSTAIPFQYKRVSAGETNTAWTVSSSLTCTAGDDQLYVIKVDAADCPQVAGVTYEYIKLAIAEVAGDPCLGGVIVMMADPRYNEDVPDAVTA